MIPEMWLPKPDLIPASRSTQSLRQLCVCTCAHVCMCVSQKLTGIEGD